MKNCTKIINKKISAAPDYWREVTYAKECYSPMERLAPGVGSRGVFLVIVNFRDEGGAWRGWLHQTIFSRALITSVTKGAV